LSSTSEDSKLKLLKEAEARAQQLVREAEKEAERIISEAEAKWRSRAEAERGRVISEAEREANIIISDAVREARLLTSKAMDEVLEEVLREAYRVIEERGFDSKTSIKNLLLESLKAIDSPKRIIVSERDLEVSREVIKGIGLSNVVVEAGDIKGGVIVESQGGIVVDNTYESRFKELQNRYLNEIRRILWG